MMMRFAMLPICLALLAPGVAQAKWLQASSAHFVVYADDRESDIRRFSEQLERYQAAMAFITGVEQVTPSPSNRVTVYVVRNEREVRKLYGEGSRFIGGFYLPRAGGSLAIVPQVNTVGTKPAFSMIVLLHEYAHHFLISTSTFPMPRWLSEGAAEFMASASFDADGTVEIGKPATHRAAELLLPGFARDVSAEALLDPAAYAHHKSKAYDAFYGKSWLLYHYLTFDQERTGQLKRYIQLMVAGKTSRDAGVEAFGDFKKLETDLDRYLFRRRMQMLRLKPDLLKTGPITVAMLSEGEMAMMPVRIRSRRGVDEAQATALLSEARAIAARYPDDPGVLVALAEAEHDAGNDSEAVVAAERALTRDPARVNAYVQKGLALFDLAEKAAPNEQAAAYHRALAPFLALNRLENDHPLPLIYNYRIRLGEGLAPNALALQGLERAAELAPFDLGLRMMLGLQQLRFGQREQARASLEPVAYNPHGGGLAKAARAALDRMGSDPEWDGTGLAVSDDDDTVSGGEERAVRPLAEGW